MRLCDIATFIKSANAGASILTFDIGLPTADAMERVRKSEVINAELIARLYPVRRQDVRIYYYLPSLVIKISIPRPGGNGGLDERDFDGVQQFAPLLTIDVPDLVQAS